MVLSVVFGGKDKAEEPAVRETPQVQSEQSAPGNGGLRVTAVGGGGCRA